jgi:hypothetical protein
VSDAVASRPRGQGDRAVAAHVSSPTPPGLAGLSPDPYPGSGRVKLPG